jgi:hypothetical protein
VPALVNDAVLLLKQADLAEWLATPGKPES